MSGIWDGMSKLFICILIFICLGLAFIVLTSIPIVLDKVSDYKNRDSFVEKRGKDVNFAGYGSKGSSSADVKVDGIRYDFSITDRSKIDENLECHVLFNTKNEHVILISKGEKVDFKERMMRELRWQGKVVILWIAALTFSFLYYRLVDKRITKKWKESEKQRNAKK
jgi:hypothetical protein